MGVSQARRVALDVVWKVRANNAWTHDALQTALATTQMDPRDRAFATRLAYGAVEMWGTLDEAIDRFATNPGKIHPRLRDALRVSAYELLFLDVSPHAAVDQGVELARTVAPRAAGLANAVLRRIAEAAPSFPWGDPEVELDVLARATGFPLWLAQRLVQDLGHYAGAAVMKADSGRAPLYVAHNPFKGSFEELLDSLRADNCEPQPFGPPGCVSCDDPAATVSSTALREGLAIVADASAQAIVAAIPLSAGDRVLELASGRGTKTLLLYANARRSGCEISVSAVDLHRFKVDLLRRRMQSLGAPDVEVFTLDASDGDRLSASVGEGFDLAIVDAPCSGTGTLRRHPERKWRLASDDIDELAQLGGALLASAARLVRPGGFVVYSTCTVLPAENQHVVRGFLDETGGDGFSLVDIGVYITPHMRSAVTPEGFFQTLPAPDGPDGHFCALLQRHRTQ